MSIDRSAIDRERAADVLMSDDLNLSHAAGRDYALMEVDALIASGVVRDAADVRAPLLQAMWDAMGILGFDQDGDKTPDATIAGMSVGGFVELFLFSMRQARREHDEAVDEVPLPGDIERLKADVRAEALAPWHALCDEVGIPHDPEGLVRHHRGNAGLAHVAQARTEGYREGRADAIAPVEAALEDMRAIMSTDVDFGPIFRALEGESPALDAVKAAERERIAQHVPEECPDTGCPICICVAAYVEREHARIACERDDG